MKVAIADDDAAVCQRIRECLIVYNIQVHEDMDPPDIYLDCNSLYEACVNGKQYDFIFLDIDFTGSGKIPDFFRDPSQNRKQQMDGITLGSYLRRLPYLKESNIVFVTSYDQFASEVISNVRPAGFIKKPISVTSISDTIQKVLRYQELTNRLFEFTYKKTIMRIRVARIRYLTSCGRKIIVKMEDGCASFYGKLSEVSMLSCFESFLNIHKSYLVNPDYIERYTTNSISLYGLEHETLPVSRTQQSVVDAWLMKN